LMAFAGFFRVRSACGVSPAGRRQPRLRFRCRLEKTDSWLPGLVLWTTRFPVLQCPRWLCLGYRVQNRRHAVPLSSASLIPPSWTPPQLPLANRVFGRGTKAAAPKNDIFASILRSTSGGDHDLPSNVPNQQNEFHSIHRARHRQNARQAKSAAPQRATWSLTFDWGKGHAAGGDMAQPLSQDSQTFPFRHLHATHPGRPVGSGRHGSG
jgi:hypothetical protein